MCRRQFTSQHLTSVATFAALVVVTTASGMQSASQPVNFTRQIRPILSQHCLICHGTDKAARQAELSLLTFEDATDLRRGHDLGRDR